MAKLVIAIRETPAGTPASGVDVEVALASNPASPLTTITTDANGLATYEVDGNPGPLVLDGTIGGKTKLRDGRTQDQMGTYFPEDLVYILRTLGNGVIKGYSDPDTAANDMALSPGTGRKINVATGAIILDGRVYRCTATTALDIAANATGSTRYDRVIARLTRDGQTEEGKFELAVLTGTTDSAGPSLTKSAATIEYSLGKIQVVNGAASFVTGDITDERYSTTLYQAYVQLNPNAFLTQAASWTNGDILYVSGGTVTRLPIGSANQILKVSSGVPTWSTVALTLVVQAGDSTIDAAVGTLDFNATHFSVTSSPAGEGNIALAAGGVGTTELADGAATNAKLASGIDAVKIGDGSVSNTEFQTLNGVTSAIQTQIDGKSDTGHSHATSGIEVRRANVLTVESATMLNFGTQFVVSEAPAAGNATIVANTGSTVNHLAAGNHTHDGYATLFAYLESDTARQVTSTLADVESVTIGPLADGVTYDIECEVDMRASLDSGTGYVVAYAKIGSDSSVSGTQTGTTGGERTIRSFATKSGVTGDGVTSYTLYARAQMQAGGTDGSISATTIIGRAYPRTVA